MAVFTEYRKKTAYPFRFAGTLAVRRIVGGVPSDPKVAEGWLKSKLTDKPDSQIQQMVAETMVERGVSAEEAVEIVNTMKNLNGFKRDENGLYIEGRQLKAAIKEATNVAYAAGKLLNNGKNSWGKTSKGILGFVTEHVFVADDKLHLGVTEPTGIEQRFVHTWRGSSIQYEEYVDNVEINFTIVSDHDFAEKDWAAIWTTGEWQGLGASRSQGYGRYEIVRWDRIK